jgi:hypothetical protein
MRRIAGLVLIGLGAFLVSTAVLARFYVLDQVRVIPIDKLVQTVAPGTGTYFDSDPATLSEKRADLVATRRVKPDVAASNDTTGVWDVSLKIETGDGAFVLASVDRVAYDRKNAQSVHCCGEAVDSAPVQHDGVTYQFPFSTAKQTYQFWDVTSRKAYPARYVSQEKIQGLTTYKFIQEIPTQELTKQEVPGSLVGESAPSFQAPVMYSNTRTVWVEPTTGLIIKGSEQTRTTLRNSAGEDKVIVLEATLTFDNATQRSQADLAKDGINQLRLVGLIVPLVGLILGLAFVVVGYLLRRSSGRPQAGADDRGAELVPAGGPAHAAEPDEPEPETDEPESTRRPTDTRPTTG